MAKNSAGGGPPQGLISKFVQDGPPVGGYAPVEIKRSLPKGGASSLVLMGGSVFLFGFGMYKIISANRERREFRREEMDIRMSILPFLTAEADVQGVFLRGKWLEQEEELMKGVHGWEAGASSYKTTYMPPMEIKGMGPMFPRI